MASRSELGPGTGKDFVAQTLDGRVAEVKVVKSHQNQDRALEDIAERKGGYKVLRNVSYLLAFLEFAITVESGTIGNRGSILDGAMLGSAILGSLGAAAYFDGKRQNSEEKIDQIQKNRLSTIYGPKTPPLG